MKISRHKLINKVAILLLAFASMLRCNLLNEMFFPEIVKMGDEKLIQFESMHKVDRGALGLLPLPQDAMIRIERRYGKDAARVGYDVMLHIFDNTDKDYQRTIALKKMNNRYIWLSEQETIFGINTYETADGVSREEIVLTYDTEQTIEEDGIKVYSNKTQFYYYGEDERLRKSNLTLKDIQPILNEWKAIKKSRSVKQK